MQRLDWIVLGIGVAGWAYMGHEIYIWIKEKK